GSIDPSPTRPKRGYPAGRVASSRPSEALDRRHQLADLLVRVATAAGDRIPNAVIRVVVEELESDAVESLVDRGDLSEHVDAVRLVLHHPREAPHLALDPLEAFANGVLVGDVAGGAIRVHVPGVYTGRGYRLRERPGSNQVNPRPTGGCGLT